MLLYQQRKEFLINDEEHGTYFVFQKHVKHYVYSYVISKPQNNFNNFRVLQLCSVANEARCFCMTEIKIEDFDEIFSCTKGETQILVGK